jgi:hypothetical protein
MSSSAFCKGHICFLYQAIQLVVRVESAHAGVFGDRKFCFLQSFFSSHHASGMVSMSSAEVFFQEAHAQYLTLAAHQDEYYPQDS